jgi:hypothetical protein
MKIFLIVFFFVVTSVQLMGQSFLPSIFYNGIDTFIIGDNISKYKNTIKSGGFSSIQTTQVKNKLLSTFQSNIDSIAPYKIDTISFRYKSLTFIDSTLQDINFTNLYRVKDYENAIEHVEGKMKILKNYICEQLHKRGKAKKFVPIPNRRYYGYQWKKGNFIIELSMQFEVPKDRFITLMLNFYYKDAYSFN